MQLGGIDISIFVLYVVVVIALGMYAARKTRSSERDYFLAGDKLPWWLIGGSIVASNLSSHQFVAQTGAAYRRGFVLTSGEWAAIVLGLNALLWIFLPFYIRNGFYTMPEFLEKRFGTTARVTYGGLTILIYIFVEISSVLFLGAMALHQLFPALPVLTSIIILAFLTSLYTITGGLRAVVWTEMLQLCVLLTGGIVLALATLNYSGGWSALMATSGEWHLLLPASDPDFPWTKYLGGSLCVSAFYWGTNQFIVQRTLGAKDEMNARMGVILAMYLKFLLPFLTVVPGLMAAKIFPVHLFPELAQTPDLTFPMLVEKLLPPGLIGLVLAGLIAAIMSHVSGALNSCTTIASMDFYLPYIRKGASEQQVVRFGKIVGAVVAVLGIFWAWVMVSHSHRPVFIYIMDAYGYFAPGITTMFFLGIFWKRATHAGALAAAFATVPLSLVLQKIYGMPFYNRTGITFWACLAIGIVVSLMTKPKPEAELKGLIWNKESLVLPKEQRHQMRGWRNPFIWWAIVNGAVLFMFIRYH